MTTMRAPDESVSAMLPQAAAPVVGTPAEPTKRKALQGRHDWLVSYLQIGPLALVLLSMFVLPALLFVIVLDVIALAILYVVRLFFSR